MIFQFYGNFYGECLKICLVFWDRGILDTTALLHTARKVAGSGWLRQNQRRGLGVEDRVHDLLCLTISNSDWYSHIRITLAHFLPGLSKISWQATGSCDSDRCVNNNSCSTKCCVWCAAICLETDGGQFEHHMLTTRSAWLSLFTVMRFSKANGHRTYVYEIFDLLWTS
jgi:hypothetical protein